MRVVFTTAAEADLETIGDWIATYSPARAATFVLELRDRCERLASLPRAYPLVPRHEGAGIRRKPYGDYLIFYRVGSDTVEIVHILHGARDYEKLLFPED
jgi:toxin ParE1/3/4